MAGRASLFLLLLLALPASVDAQRAAPAQNVVYAELLGNALFGGSVNYERMLTPQFSARVGASPFGAFPVMLNYLPGRGPHLAEAGIGVLANGSNENFLGTATLGYRHQPRNGGLVLRAGWTPLIGAEGVATWVGASVGFAF
jgi:hypothetical protein